MMNEDSQQVCFHDSISDGISRKKTRHEKIDSEAKGLQDIPWHHLVILAQRPVPVELVVHSGR
jgi:hypothetical protein